MSLIPNNRKASGWLGGFFVAMLASGLSSVASHAAAYEVIVRTDHAPVQSGRKVIARVRKGQLLTVTDVKWPWYGVRVFIAGRTVRRWIHQKYVRESLSFAEKQRLMKKAEVLNKQVLRLIDELEYKKGIPLAEQVLSICRRVHGGDHTDTATALDHLGRLHKGDGDYPSARSNFKDALAIRELRLSRYHPLVALSLDHYGEILCLDDEYQKARPYFEKALAIRQARKGAKDASIAFSYNNLAVWFRLAGDNVEARAYYEKALAIREKVLGKRHPFTVHSIENLGLCLTAMGYYREAYRHLKRSLKINRELHRVNHPAIATSLHNLGLVLQLKSDYLAAHSHFKQALAIREKVFDKNHPQTAIILNSLGGLLNLMGRFDEARLYLERALAVNEQTFGKNHAATALSINNLGQLLQSMGDYRGARTHFERVLAIYKKSSGENHPDTATALDNLGLVLKTMGDHAMARSYYEKALKIRQASLGKKHSAIATSLHNLGSLLAAMGDFAHAQQYLEKSLAMSKETLSPKHPDVAATLSNQGILLQSKRDYAAAERCFKEALEIDEETLGPQHPNTATSLSNLGGLFFLMRDYPQARSYLERALTIRKTKLGPNHPDTGYLLNDVGVILSTTGNHAAAKSRFEQASEIWKVTLGDTHPHRAQSLENLAILSARSGHWREASNHMDRARRILRRHAMRVLPILTEREQLDFLGSARHSLKIALSLGLQRRDDDRMCSLSATWLVNGKAESQQAISERYQLVGPKANDLIVRLRGLRNELARRSMLVPKSGKEKSHLQQLAALQEQVDGLVRKLGELTLGPSPKDELWVSLEKVRHALKRDQVLISIARFGVHNIQAQNKQKTWQPARYAAWIIPASGRGRIDVVDLGEAKEIDQAVREARQAIQGGPKTREETAEAEAEKRVQKSLRRLATLVLDPLFPHLGEAKRLIVSPDGQLWLAPWAALPMENGKYAIEEYEISHVVSGRELVTQHNQRASKISSIVLADPDYDYNLMRIGRDDPAPRKPIDHSRRRGSGSLSELSRVARLPFTAAEAHAIGPSIEKYTGVAPKLYLEDEAREDVFKSVRGTRVLTISTHGFFLRDQQAKRQEHGLSLQQTCSVTLTIDGKPLQNPLLRCGLLLAGCNRRDQPFADGEDGVLTGLEIVGANLRGTELVVLSACETGVGDVRIGEGVAGLRQAFQLAGAEAVIASLWSVPDHETARLMKSFFEHLAAGKSKSSALRAAQLERIASRRERHEAAHPFYWAAFTLTGRE